MWQKNNGKSEAHILQNRFTRFLLTTIGRDKAAYLDKQSKRKVREILMVQVDNKSLCEIEPQIWKKLILGEALDEISKRDRYIFLARALDGKSYDDLANELGLGYKGVAAAYYRALQKLKRALRGD